MPDRIWTREKIQIGFKRFVSEHGRLPTSFEIDDMPDLPSSRQIQRAFGGLPKIREELGYGEINFTKGSLRDAYEHGIKGLKSEQDLEMELVSQFGELFVHIEKRFGSHKNRVDFMVFTPEGNFGIDIFYSDHPRAMINALNIKIPHYEEFPIDIPLYFVCSNPVFTDDSISFAVRNMGKLKDRSNIKVVGLSGFRSKLAEHTRYKDPKNFIPLISGS
jgi:hypothetical protein